MRTQQPDKRIPIFAIHVQPSRTLKTSSYNSHLIQVLNINSDDKTEIFNTFYYYGYFKQFSILGMSEARGLHDTTMELKFLLNRIGINTFHISDGN